MKKAIVILMVLACCACAAAILFNEGSDATTTGSGTQADPYTFIDIGAHSGSILNSSYVLVGSSITLTNDDYDDVDYLVNDVTSGHGLSVTGTGLSGTLTGSLGQTVTITVDWVDYGGDSGTYYHTFTVVDDRNCTITTQSNNEQYGSVSPPSRVVPKGTTIASISGTTATLSDAYGNIVATTATDTTRYDYSFTGFTVGGSPLTVGYTFNSDTTITANFTRTENTFTITWKNYDNTTLETDYNVAWGANPAYNGATPTRPSSGGTTYTFSGWSPTPSSVTGNQTYTAQFSSSTTYTYTLTYNANGGSGAPSTQSQSSTASSYSFTVSNTTPTRSGYTFLGWGNTSDATVPIYDGGDTITLQSSSPTKTIYAVWYRNPSVTGSGTQADPYTYLDIYGSGAGILNSSYVKAGTSITITNNDYDEIDYIVNDVTSGHGLSVTGSGLSGTLTGSPGDTVTVVIDYVDYGGDSGSYSYTFTVVDDVTYTLTYDANGGSGAPAAATATTTELSKSFTVSNATPTRSGYNFLGWADSSSATVAQYTGGNTINLAYSAPTKTIYAVWAEIVTYTLTYDANGGSGAPTAQTNTNSTGSYSFTLHVGQPTRTDYNFLGWADTDDAVTAQYHGGDTITLYAASPTKTIYAVWSETEVSYTYVLTYDANGGSDAPAAESQTTTAVSYSFTISNIAPTRADYDFLGWADSADAAAAQYIGGNTIVLNSSAPTKTIYAVWVEQGQTTYTYTLKFNGNGGSGVPVTMTASGTALTYSFTIPDTKPVKDGVVFVGWSLAPSSSSAQYTPGATIPVSADQEVTLYAVWNDDNGFSFSIEYLIKQIANTFFGGSTSLAGLAMIVICWLLIIAVLANLGAPIAYSVAPMIPVVIVFAAMGIISTDITMIVIIVCAVFSAMAVRNIVQGD